MIDQEKITDIEFKRLFEAYKSENQINSQSEQEEIISKINYLNVLINELVLKKYLNEKITINKNSLKVILKKSLNENQKLSSFTNTQMQEIMENLNTQLNKEMFLDSLDPEKFKDININKNLLREKSIKIYRIKDQEIDINDVNKNEYKQNVENYLIKLKIIDLDEYIRKNLIKETMLNNYYDDNIEKYTIPEKITYEQIIISDKKLDKIEYESYKNKENLLATFIDKSKNEILPKIFNELLKINVGENSEVFDIGELKYIVKVLNKKAKKVLSFEEAKEEIITNIVSEEITNIKKLEIDKLDSNLIENKTIYTDDFLFYENIDLKYSKILKGNKIGSYIQNENYIEYSLDKVDIELIPEKLQIQFINKYINFIKIRDSEDYNYSQNRLTLIEEIKVNYFVNNILIDQSTINDERLNSILLIKENIPLKISLVNKSYILKKSNEDFIDENQIKELFVNTFYNELLNSIKSLYKIEINNEKIFNN